MSGEASQEKAQKTAQVGGDRAKGEWRKMGLTEKRAKQSRSISRHPEIVEKVKAQARVGDVVRTR